MPLIITFAAPDPEYAEAFRAYRNYLEDVAGWIGGNYGWADSLAAGVHDAVLGHPPVTKIQRRQVTQAGREEITRSLQRSWSNLRRIHQEVDGDGGEFNEEANAWLPTQSYYAVFHAIRAFGFASNQDVPDNHRGLLNLISRTVVHGRLPYPWSAACEGCPHTGDVTYIGFQDVDEVHVLSRPDPETSESRLAMWLRTTRKKELDRRFGDSRTRNVKPGRMRRNLSKADKAKLADNLPATTLFDALWRVRKKANYEDADTFVLGAAGAQDARRLGESLVIVTDATVAALEALTSAYVGPDMIADTIAGYTTRTESENAGLGRHARSWISRASIETPF